MKTIYIKINRAIIKYMCFLLLIQSITGFVSVSLANSELTASQLLTSVENKIPLSHPRIFVTQSTLPALIAEVNGSGTKANMYNALKKWVDGNLVNIPNNMSWAPVDVMSAFAFVYLIEQDVKYSNAVKQLMNTMLTNVPKSNGVNVANDARSLAIAYDWINNSLSASEKQQYVTAMLNYVDWWPFPAGTEWYPSQWNGDGFSGWFPKPYTFTNSGPFVGMKNLYVGIAIFRDGVNDARGDQIVRDYGHYLEYNLVPAFNLVAGKKGGWQEDYGHLNIAWPIIKQIELWDVATGRGLMPKFTAGTTYGRWLLYTTRPNGSGTLQGNSATVWDNKFGNASKTFDALYQAHYNDGLVSWFINGSFSQRDLAEAILWYDDSVSRTNLSSVPLAEYFDGTGIVIMRDGWNIGGISTPSDDTFARFQCGNWYDSHQHLDQGGLYIYRKGPLLVDGQKTTVFRGTQYHNTIMIDNEDQIFSYDNIYSGKEDWKNYGEGTSSDLADITSFEHKNDYDYSLCDLSNAYKKSKLDTFNRHVVYLRPNYFIVYDRVKTTSASYSKKVLWNSFGEPTLINSDTIKIDSGLGGRLLAKVLLPQNNSINITNVANVTNYTKEQSNWNIEIQPSNAQLNDFFLHVMYVTDSTVGSMPGTVRISNSDGNMQSDNMVGAHIKDSTMNHVTLFSSDPEGDIPSGNIVYTISPTANSKHYLFGLQPKSGYDVNVATSGSTQAITVSYGSNYTTSSNGTLSFYVDSAGVLIVDTIPPKSPTGLVSY